MRAMELPARAELESIAVDAGNLALRHFRHVASERKADRTLVTGDGASAGDPSIVAHAKAHLRHRIRYPGKVRSLGSSAYHAALVARGVAEVAILGHVHLWDVAAIGAVLQAVGGCFVYLD